MALTDLLGGVRRLARPLALGLVVYGCGGAEPGSGGKSKLFCEEYTRICPGSFEQNELEECKQFCEEQEESYLHNRDCAFLACAVETGYCDNQVKGDPQIAACMMNKYGWRDCSPGGKCLPPE